MLATTDDLRSLVGALAGLDAGDTEVEAITRLALLEQIKSAATAAQVRETVRVDDLRRADEEVRNVPSPKCGRGLAAEIGLARKASARKGSQYLGFARALTAEMPHAFAALASGVLTEWRATILVRETGYLTRESREEIDRRLCADPTALLGVGDRELDAQARALAYELEPRAVVDRKAKADKDRRVSVRPAPDLMTQLSALLPMAQGISVFAALKKHADSVVGGDERSHAQIMADTLVERVTGQASAAAVQITVNVVMSAETLLTDVDIPAEIPGYGPIPARVARGLIADGHAPDSDTTTAIRRLYTRPADGTLVSMDARSRCYPSALAHFISMRDRRCRVPYCDAPIEEIDHAHPHRHGGATTAVNGDGLCVTHNRAKDADGWAFHVINTADTNAAGTDTASRHTIDIHTPTGTVHRSTSPRTVGHRPSTVSRIETRLRALLVAA